jgi:2-dehydro-3-deoxygalactonokinase
LIAVDWGTSNFRAFRLAPDGAIRERRSSPRGILYVQDAQFESVLSEEVGDWIEQGETQILLCGMVGSRQGWVEAAYLPCPVGIAELVRSAVRIPFSRAQVQMIPGVIASDENGVPETMRGEETEAIGILETCKGNGLVCLPGSHSKWIRLRDSRIWSFRTHFTGELFAALQKCTILGRTMTVADAKISEAFEKGVARAGESGGLLHHLFGVRTLTLTGQILPEDSASYLSGLLIGHEVRNALESNTDVYLVGSSPLSSLYARVIELCGGSPRIEGGPAAARGLAAIGARLTWT